VKWPKRVAIGAVVLIAFGVSGVMCARVGERGRYVGEYSTYGAGPDGTRGLFLLAEGLDARPRRWAEDLGRLPDRGMLVALGSCQQLMRRELTRIERENLQAWVEGGGVLVVAGAPDYLRDVDFGVRLTTAGAQCRPTAGLLAMLDQAEREERGEELEEDEEDLPEVEDLPDRFGDDPAGTYDEVVEQDGPGELVAVVGDAAPYDDVPRLAMRRPLGIAVDEDRTRSTLLRLVDDAGLPGEPAGVRVDVGDGAVVVLASASLLQNRDLSARGGGVLFSRLVREHAADGPVLFDEYHLGVGQRRSFMRYLRQTGAMPLVIQVLLLIGLVLWRLGAKFGAHQRPAPDDPGGTASYVEGVGTLYAKAKDPAGAIAILIRRALERVAAHHHLPSRDAGRLADALESKHQHDAAKAVRDIAAVQAQPMPRGGLSKVAERLDALTRTAMA